ATFRMRANERVQGRNAALFMRQDVPTQRALLLHDGAPSAQAIVEAFRTQYRGMRGEVRDLRQVSLTENFDALYQDIKTLDPDLIYYMGGGRTGAETLKAMVERGYSGRFLVTDSAYADASYNTIGSVLEGTYATALQPARGDRFTSWKEAYEKDNGPVGLLSPEGYDAAAILLQAAARVAKVESDGTTKLGRQAMVGNIRSAPYTGITGVMGFDGNGDRSALTATVMKFENGQFKQAAAPAPTPVPAPAATPSTSTP
ncbi:MAG: ABC transporter substrate-binding protein, partial [Chloroflexota bacterium]